MKTLLLYDYRYKKFITDNLQSLINKKWVDIDDEDYETLQNAIDDYLEDESYSQGEGYASASEFAELKNQVESIKPFAWDVNENGIYFVDEEGYVVAKIDSTGLYAINLDGSSSGSGLTAGVTSFNGETGDIEYSPTLSLNDLTDVLISSLSDGQALLYNSTASKWKNTTVSGSMDSGITITEY